MHSLRNAVLATLAFYEQLQVSLTLQETHTYLINPSRVDLVPHGVGDVTLAEVVHTLDTLVHSGRVFCTDGFYALSRDNSREVRVEQEKINAQKWRKLLRIAWWLQAVPYVRAIFSSGSLALGNPDLDSDFDVFIITADKRLYMCRVFLLVAASLLRVRRKRLDTVAPDKLCFNHYVTERELMIPYESVVTAQIFSSLVPLCGRDDVIAAFFASNGWINKFLYNFRPIKDMVRRSIAPSRFLQGVAHFGEWLLNNKAGDLIEKLLRRWQQGRIRKNPLTYASGGRIVFTDTQLEFHPRSFEVTVIAGYNERLQSIGIVPTVSEHDSGLQ